MGEAVDRSLAAAEAQLDRIDDAGATAADDAPSSDAVDLTDGMHIEQGDAHLEAPAALGLTTDEILLELDGTPDAEVADCVDAFTDAWNARDLDSLLELVRGDCETPGLGNDLDHFPEAIEDVWERRPSTVLTRGVHDGQVLAVMWELGEGDAWWRIATLHFDDCTEGQIGVIEFTDDPNLLEDIETVAPDGDLDEGTRWEEWSDGAIDER